MGPEPRRLRIETTLKSLHVEPTIQMLLKTAKDVALKLWALPLLADRILRNLVVHP